MEKTTQSMMKDCKKCEKAGLTLNKKCEFSVEKVKFLGHNITATGTEADPDKISAIEKMPEPHNWKRPTVSWEW